MKALKAVTIRVYGRVQGVGFRYFILRNAQALGLRGYVRNEPSGNEVFIYAEGEPEAIDRLIALARKGPLAARVDQVEIEEVSPSHQWQDFQVVF